jgi:succinate-semialdehyde dehydrogenase/glutarate-semialdehyde dehydrogenase
MELARDAYLNGRWQPTRARFPVLDPFDGARIAEVADCDDAVIDAAIAAAASAFPGWRRRVAADRGHLIRQLGERMLRDEDRLAALCTRENGKPQHEAIAEVRYAATFLTWFSAEAERAYGDVIPASHESQRMHVVREPVGPCAVITPWNFPYAMLTRKLGAALAAGCTVVAKPAEQTPLGALALAQLCDEAGFPAGVVNVVPAADGARAGGRLVRARELRKVSFTGSTEVGRAIARAAADDLKRVSLELGGNAPFVVFADADLDLAVAGAMVAKFRNTGQTCVAANRFIVEDPVADEFERRLCTAVAKLRVGRGSDPGVTLGPLIDDDAVAKVARLVEDAVVHGARIALGKAPRGGSRLVEPVVLADVSSEMQLWREEIFGPIVALRRARDEEHALRLANESDAGLVAYAFTRDLARAQRAQDALEAGMVGINDGLVSAAQAPFGGVKQSGFGREGSRYGLDDYSQLKYIATRFA